VRPTEDVDVIVGITSRSAYYRLEDELRGLGFMQSMRPGDPICRWEVESVIVDIMPIDETVLGFSNRWYESAMLSAITVSLVGATVRIVSAPCFIATKLEAFRERGAGDYMLSPDLEDIIAVLDGRGEVVEEIRAAEDELREFLRDWAVRLLNEPAFLDALPGYLRGDAVGQARLPLLLRRLQQIAEIR
jgi:predicted nucleotidyltransferase